jgi:putative Holliday junction resolvase
MPDTPEPPANTAGGTTTISSVLGFDYGDRRIGLATGQTITATATPLKTIRQVNGNPDWTAIATEIERWRPQALIVGMPYYSDGSGDGNDGNENRMTARVRQFCYELGKRFKLPVYQIDETLSSHQAEAALKQDMKIDQHNKHEIDRMAAAIILQRWLDQNSQ